MSEKLSYVTCWYEDKRNGDLSTVNVDCVHPKHCMKIARKLRPKFHKIIRVIYTERLFTNEEA